MFNFRFHLMRYLLFTLSIFLSLFPIFSVSQIDSCLVINQSGDYILNQSIYTNSDNCIEIESSNVSLFCNGFFIEGNSSIERLDSVYNETTDKITIIVNDHNGILVKNTNVHISNCFVDSFLNGIKVEDNVGVDLSTNISIINSSFSNMELYGIEVGFNSYNRVILNELLFNNIGSSGFYGGYRDYPKVSFSNFYMNNVTNGISYGSAINFSVENGEMYNVSEIPFNFGVSSHIFIENVSVKGNFSIGLEINAISGPSNFSNIDFESSNLNSEAISYLGRNACSDITFQNVSLNGFNFDFIRNNLSDLSAKINFQYPIMICNLSANNSLENINFNNKSAQIYFSKNLLIKNISNMPYLRIAHSNNFTITEVSNLENLYIENSTNSTIRNVSINSIHISKFKQSNINNIFSTDIHLGRSDNNIFSNIFPLDLSLGFYVSNSNFNIINNSNFTGLNSNRSSYSLFVDDSFSNQISNSNFNGDVLLSSSENNSFFLNKFYGNTTILDSENNYFNKSINGDNLGNYWYNYYLGGPAGYLEINQSNESLSQGVSNCYTAEKRGEYFVCLVPYSYLIYNNTWDYAPLVEKNRFRPSMNSSLQENLTYNLSKLELKFNALFNSNITNFKYIIGDKTIDISDQLNSSEFKIRLPKYGFHTITFEYSNHLKFTNKERLFINTSLKLNSLPGDIDGDGINDSQDRIKGSSSNINSNLNISFEINNSINLSREFNSTQNISIKKNGKKFIEFKKDFSNFSIDLTNISLIEENNENTSKLIISGIELDNNESKTIYFTMINNSNFTSLCLKDSEIFSFDEISQNCSLSDEYFVDNIPYSYNGIEVEYENQSELLLKISGLTHSAVEQVCTENWSYSSWSTCSSNIQTRTATDLNNCGTIITRDELTQSCTSSSSEGGGGSSSSTSENEDDTILIDNSINFNIYVDGRRILRDKFIENKEEVSLEIGENKVIFKHDFDEGELDLKNTQLITEYNEDINYLIVKELELQSGEDKIIKLENNFNSNEICIIDREISSKSSLSKTCSNDFEIKLKCDSKYYGDYKCDKSTLYYTIYGLSHSAVYETPEISEEEESVDIVSSENINQENEKINENEKIQEIQIETTLDNNTNQNLNINIDKNQNNEISKNISSSSLEFEDETSTTWTSYLMKGIIFLLILLVILFILK